MSVDVRGCEARERTHGLDDKAEGDAVPSRGLLGEVEDRDEDVVLVHVELVQGHLLMRRRRPSAVESKSGEGRAMGDGPRRRVRSR